MEVDLSGKVALVVGGAEGVGRSIVEALAACGARVYVAEEAVQTALSTAIEICAAGGSVSALRLDPTDAAEWSEALAQISEERGRIDFLVYACGMSPDLPLEETEPDLWWQVVEVNCSGFFLACQTVIPYLTGDRGGVVIAVAPGLGGRADPERLAACATRAASAMLIRCLAEAYAADEVRVCGVDAAGPDDSAGEQVAAVVAFLCSDHAAGVTGVIVNAAGESGLS